ncbi:MAG: hypothetical protein ABIK92_18425 [Pseudomonadota bacterium]
MTSKSSGIKRIIFFIESYFNMRDYKRFGINIFEDNGFDVEIWDFTPFIATDEFKILVKPPAFNCDNWRLFHTKKEAITAIKGLDYTCFIISLIRYTPKTLRIFRMILKKKIKRCVVTMALPTVDRSGLKLSKRFSLKFKLVTWNGVLTKILYSLPYGLLNVKPADFLLVIGGDKYNGTSGLVVTAQSEIVWAHYLDYDIYLKEADMPEPVDAKRGIFIDEFKPFHPDYAYTGHSSPVSPDEYYPKLCKFFDYLESKNGFKITIAAHPRSRYEDLPDYFGGRPVIRGKTSELVRTSGFVIMHTSTAINFAILYKKPVIIVTTDKYSEYWVEDPTPEWMAEFFGKKVHNLDYPIKFDLQNELYVDENKYCAYKNHYIKKEGTEDLYSWQILANRIKKV